MGSPVGEQLRLVESPICGVYRMDMDVANALLMVWGHRLGPCHRPFGQEAYSLEVLGSPVAVAISASIVHGPVAGYQRDEVVELARLGAAVPWANRVMLRLWRETCAQRWRYWPVAAAVSYSHNAMHRGDLYRFDGWEKVTDNCGSTGGGTWSRPRRLGDAALGKKTLWLFRYEVARGHAR